MPLTPSQTRDLIELKINNNALLGFQDLALKRILISLQDNMDSLVVGAGGEPTIAAGTTAQYWRGDKTFQTLNKAAVGLSAVPNIDATNAANLSAGFLLAARFGPSTIPISAINATGTPSGTTVLFGDGTWGAYAYSDGDKGDVTIGAGGTSITLNDDAVTLNKLPEISQYRVLGRVAAGIGDVSEITGSDITTFLDVFNSTTAGIVTASGGGTTNFLRADGTWAPAGSGGTLSDGTYNDIAVSSGGTILTIVNGSITDSMVNDVAWGKITGAPSFTVDSTVINGSANAVQGNAVFDALVLKQDVLTPAAIGSTPNANGLTLSGAVLNLQPASASFGGAVTTTNQSFAGEKTFDRVLSGANAITSQIKVGSFEIQGRTATSSLIGHNVYFDGTSFTHRATGPLSFMDINPTATSFLFGMATSATAGTAATVTYPLGVYPTGIIVGISNGYINFNSVTGSTGYGFWDDAGVLKWKNAGGSWAIFPAGGGGGLPDATYADIIVSGGTTALTIVNNAVTTAKINNLAVTNAKINDVAFSKITGITGTPTGSKFLRDDGSWQTVSGSATLTSTRLAFGDVSNNITDSANLVWDNTNKNILIGGSGSRNININVSQPTIGFLQSGTEKGVIGISDAVDALVFESAVGDLAIRLTTSKKVIISDDATRYIKIGFVDSADTICGDAPIFQTHTDTTALGHGSTAFVFQNLDSGNSSRIGFKNHLGDFMGEIGPNNVDSNFVVIASDPCTHFVFGFHADGVNDTPLIQMNPDGTVKFFHWATGAIDYTHPGIWDFKNNWFVFGDDTNDGSHTLQVHGAGKMGLLSSQPYIYFQGTGVSQPFTGFLPTNTGGYVNLLSGTNGGIVTFGVSDGDELPTIIAGGVGHATPTVAAVTIRGYKFDGTNSLATATGTAPILSVEAGGTPKFKVLADGSLYINGSVGTAGQVITSGGAGATAAWGAGGGGGGGTPGGSNTQVQYNNSGAFGASAALAFVSGGLQFTNTSDAFNTLDGVIGVHSNNFMYAQGLDAGGFIFASGATRTEMLQLRASDNSILFFAGNTIRMWVRNNVIEVNDPVVWLKTGTNQNFQISNVVSANDFPIASLYPTTGTDVGQALYVIPKGTGFSSTIKSRLFLMNTDYIADSTNYEGLLFGANGASFDINATKGGTGTLRPIDFQIGGTSSLKLFVNGSIGFNGSTGTSGQVLTSAGTGAAPTWTTGPVGGTYTPSFTNGSNVTGGTTNTSQYMRVGNIVTVSVMVGVTVTAGTTASDFTLSLPVASAMTASEQLNGGGSVAGFGAAVSVEANTTTDTANFSFVSPATGSFTIRAVFQYIII